MDTVKRLLSDPSPRKKHGTSKSMTATDLRSIIRKLYGKPGQIPKVISCTDNPQKSHLRDPCFHANSLDIGFWPVTGN